MFPICAVNDGWLHPCSCKRMYRDVYASMRAMRTHSC